MISSAIDVEIYAPDTLILIPGIETIVDVSLSSRVDAASVQYGLVFNSLEFVKHTWETKPVCKGLGLGQRISNRLVIEAPKRPECLAGVYPIWIEVNIRNGEGQLRSYRHPIEVTVNKFVEWRPKLIPNRAERPGAFILQLTNLSNHTVQFAITGEEIPEDRHNENGSEIGSTIRSDRRRSCVFDIEPGKPILYPGQLGQIDVLVKVLELRPLNPIKFKLNVEPQEPS